MPPARWFFRQTRRVVALIAAIVVFVVAAGFLLLRASLPLLDGKQEFAGLNDEVSIERDALGVVTISATDRLDAAFATGLVHAQERFFQMDLQRRAGAGELSALLGPATIELDKQKRLHRFRHRARNMVAELPEEDLALYRAYTRGVNRGLARLGARPFEYFLLGVKPERWRVEDILLTIFSMYFELDDERARREAELGVLQEVLSPAAYRWLIQDGTVWDAPLRGAVAPAEAIPGPADLDVRDLPAELFGWTSPPERAATAPGSNNWAVSGARSASGRALLAGDMHLGHAVPNIWFRARLVVAAEDLDITGVSLPGTPLIVAGSNRHVAWSFTNSYGDWSDLVVLETDPEDPSQYRTAAGWRPFGEAVEIIGVRGGESMAVTIRETIWGPVIDRGPRGRLRALCWLPQMAEATNSGMARFEKTRNVDEAIAVANAVGGPPQNYVVADADGRIGWTIMGRIPARAGYDPAVPSSWADGGGWMGWVDPGDYPRIVDPNDGVIWTANARTVDGDWLAMLGQGNHPVGARSRQIRDRLQARDTLSLDDMLAIQLDDRALFLERWRALLLDLLTPAVLDGYPQRAELRALVEQWGGRAAVESAGYRLVRAFRIEAVAAMTDVLLAEVRAEVPGFDLTRHSQIERPVWQALDERPAHLLSPLYASWDEFLLAVVDATLARYDGLEGGLAARTWGELNTTRVAHPLTLAVPALSGWLNMPDQQLPGDADMPRVQSPVFGASQRMAVSPGQEEAGYFHMPGGQSGHPLSPFYGAGHADWAAGKPTQFLPGKTRHRLVLRPRQP